MSGNAVSLILFFVLDRNKNSDFSAKRGLDDPKGAFGSMHGLFMDPVGPLYGTFSVSDSVKRVFNADVI